MGDLARSFDDGSTEYLEVDLSPVSGEPFTMAAWAYSDDATVDQTVMSVADKDSGNVFHALRLMGSAAGDRINASSSILGTIYTATSSSGFSADTWHHVCGVWAANNDRRVYIDGGSKGTNSNEVNVAGLDRVAIGYTCDKTPVYYLSGRVTMAGVWNVALTDAEVALLAAGWAPLFVRPESLVAFWPLTADDGDWLGTYDLTAFNTPSWAAGPGGIVYPVKLPVIY